MARLDRLSAAAKEIAEIGAAIGREFSYDLAAAAAEVSEERLQEALQQLVDAGLVFQRGAPPTFPSGGCLVHDEFDRRRFSWR